MKRLLVSLVVVVTFFVWQTPLVIAASPTPQPTSATVLEGIKIPNGVNNPLNESNVEAQPNPTPADDYTLTVSGANIPTDNFKIPKRLDFVANWFLNALPFMSTKSIRENMLPHQNNLFISGQARRCIYLPGQDKPIEEVGRTYKTELVEYLPKLTTATELLSAQTVRNAVSLKNNKYDFRGPSYEVDKAPPCDANDEGTAQDPKDVTLVQTFSIADWIRAFFDKVKVKRQLASKQLTPEGERIHCLLNGCTQDVPDLAYIGDAKKEKRVAESGGLAEMYRTDDMDTTKGEPPHGLEQNAIRTNTTYTKQMENSSDLMLCSLMTKEMQAQKGLTTRCQDFVNSCTKELPDLSQYQNGCTLKNTSALVTSNNYLTAFEKSALPQGDLPELAKQIINAAGNIYNVPPALILATMVSEGSFEHPESWSWTDANVKLWSQCGEKMPNCTKFAHPVTGSKGPVGWIDGWFFEETDKNYAGVQKVQPERTKDKVSNCNFMDAIFALAKSMQKTSGGVTYPYTTCWGHPLLMNGGPSTSCKWDEARVTTATRQYAGYCSEPPKNGPYTPQTKTNNHFDRAWTFYKAFQ